MNKIHRYTKNEWYCACNVGFDVRGVFLKNWDLVDETGYCSAEQDWEHAQYVCDNLQIPIQRIDFVKQYWTDVFE